MFERTRCWLMRFGLAALVVVALAGLAGPVDASDNLLIKINFSGPTWNLEAVEPAELEGQYGTGLEDPLPAAPHGDDVAVILWDEYQRRCCSTSTQVQSDAGSSGVSISTQ